MDDPPGQTSDDDSLCTSPLMQRTALTSNQLRQYIHRSYAAITSLQRQIYRGEESYFEDSYAHGNLFSGWDNIWIEAENGANAGEREIQATHHHKSSSLKKMPVDCRWFSTSCKLIDPKAGDGKVEAILSCGSLAEPTPKSTAAAKAASIASGEAASGRVLKRSSPLKVSSSPSTIKSTAIKTEISHEHATTSSPPAKKAKPNNDNDEMIDITKESTGTTVVADDTLAFNAQQAIPTAPPDRVTSLSASPTAKDTTREMMPTDSAAKLEMMTSHGESEATTTLLQSIHAQVKVTSQPETSVAIDVEMKDASRGNNQDDGADTTAVAVAQSNIDMDTVAPSAIQPDNESTSSKPIECNVSTSLQVDKMIAKDDDPVETKVIKPISKEKKQDQDTVKKQQAAITSETAASSTTIQKPNEVTSSTALETSHVLEVTAGAQIVEEMKISIKDNDEDATKQSRKDIDKEENKKPVVKSPSTKPDPAVTIESSKQGNLSEGKKAATADTSDSEEDITLSEMVKMKSKTSSKAQTATAHGGAQVVGTRTSSRRRKQSTHN
jgi:hypothetical protein